MKYALIVAVVVIFIATMVLMSFKGVNSTPEGDVTLLPEGTAFVRNGKEYIIKNKMLYQKYPLEQGGFVWQMVLSPFTTYTSSWEKIERKPGQGRG